MQSKGKGKADIYVEPLSDKPTSPPFLESFLVDLSLYEETKMEEPTVEAFSSLEELFNGKAIQEAKEEMEALLPLKWSPQYVFSFCVFFFFLLGFVVPYSLSLVVLILVCMTSI